MALYNPDFGGSAREAAQKQTCAHTGQGVTGLPSAGALAHISARAAKESSHSRAAAVDLWTHSAEHIRGSSEEGSAKDRMALSS